MFGVLIAVCISFSLFGCCFAESGSATVNLYWDGGGPLCDCIVGSHVPSFACNFKNNGNWSDGVKTFLDPTPINSMITNITATLYGTVGCDGFEPNPEVLLRIGDTVIADAVIIPNLPCDCGNCVGPIPLPPSFDGSCGSFSGFQRGQINSIKILAPNDDMCLYSISLYFNYTIATPFTGVLTPSSGPAAGNTEIIIQGYTPPLGEENNIVCVFNSTILVPAIVMGPSTVQCTSPSNRAMVGFVPFYVTTSSRCMQPASNPAMFEYYLNLNVSNVLPVRGPSQGGTHITVIGTSFSNASGLSCKVGSKLGNATYINNSQIICNAPSGSGTELHILISLNGQNFQDTNFTFAYDEPKTFWTNTTISWIILSVSGVAALGLILLFIGLIKSRFNKDGYHQIVEGKQITIDEVRLGPRIGKGNFGEVYKAYWRGAEIAVKKLPAHNMTAQFLKDFHKEVSLMRALRHPNVIQFLGSCTVLPDICICTEYMPRGSLYKILHDPAQPLTWTLIKKMCVDAAKGCVYLHDCTPTIVHRDLKSHNLLVDENWKVKVCDFGLSTIVEQQSRTMTACGTPCWTAPEVLRNQRYTEKADVYSFGMVLWECATRDDPFVGMPPFQVIFAVGREGLRPPLPQVCPAEFAKLITDCWDEKPNARPPMKEVLARLENIDTAGWPDINPHNLSPPVI